MEVLFGLVRNLAVEIQRVIKGGIDLEWIDALAARVEKSPQSICTDDRSSSFNSIGKVSYCYVESSLQLE